MALFDIGDIRDDDDIWVLDGDDGGNDDRYGDGDYHHDASVF